MDRQFVIVCLLALILAGCRRAEVADPRLKSPAVLAEKARELGLKNPYLNPSARNSLRELGLPMSDDLPDKQPADAAEWRKIDRSQRFDGVVLAGPINEFLPLLNHLVDSPDFRLSAVDNWGVIFTRNRSAPFEPPEPDSIAAASPAARAEILSQTALFLDAVRLARAADDYIKVALSDAPNAAAVNARAAALSLAGNRPEEALRRADHALDADGSQLSALEIKARALLAMGAADAAWQVAEKLKSAAPKDDMNVLYFHARLANSAGAYTREQDSLERLVALAEKHNLPTADYRVYLAQCYAHQGLARPALDQLEKASREPNLSPAQQSDIQTAIETVRNRTGALAN